MRHRTILQLPATLMLTLITMLTLTGCNSSSQDASAPGRVAVIDMEQVAQASGFSQRMGMIMQRVQEEEHARLQQVQKELGIVPNAPMPTDAAQAEKMGQAQLQMRQAIEQAQQRIETIRYGELEQFRSMVRPIAERVAHARGCSIVMEKRDDMLSVDPAADITDEVVAELPRQSSATGPSHQLNPPDAGGPVLPTPGQMGPQGTGPGSSAPASPSPTGSIPRQFLPGGAQNPPATPATTPAQ